MRANPTDGIGPHKRRLRRERELWSGRPTRIDTMRQVHPPDRAPFRPENPSSNYKALPAPQ